MGGFSPIREVEHAMIFVCTGWISRWILLAIGTLLTKKYLHLNVRKNGFAMRGEMMMVAAESIGVGEDLIPPLSPISYSLHDSFLPSHCASCLSPLLSSSIPTLSYNHLRYCSPSCYSSHSPLHTSSSTTNTLLHEEEEEETSDLRVALLLLLQIKRHQHPPFQSYHRICGLLSNRQNLLTSTHHNVRIRNRAKAIAMRHDDIDYQLEEAVLCAVLTNAVDVQDKNGRSVGIAVYDISFSWINHSCSPNACYRFLPPNTQCTPTHPRFLITPASSSNPSEPISNCHLLKGIDGGPRIVVRSIKMIKKGEEVTIAYTDLLQPKEMRQSELWSKYRFRCCCRRCAAVPLTYVDQRLQVIFLCTTTISCIDRLQDRDVMFHYCVDYNRLTDKQQIPHTAGSAYLLCSIGSHVSKETLGSSESLLNYDFCTEYIDDAIDDYLSSNDAESCCKKLEHALLNGFHDEIKLHPQNHFCLNAYTTLASAYSSLTGGLKFSAAYSLLLALLTHDLYLHESSLITSVSNFWMGAGESLVKLGTRLLSSLDLSSCRKKRCACGLLEANNYDDSKRIFECVSEITGKVWKFLVDGNGYLEGVKDLVDLRWFDDNGGRCATVEEEVLRLGDHCLLYGRILSNICGSLYARVDDGEVSVNKSYVL